MIDTEQETVDALEAFAAPAPLAALNDALARAQGEFPPITRDKEVTSCRPGSRSPGFRNRRSSSDRPGESVGAFAARMFRPAEAARLAHHIFRRYGLQPWGGSCS